MTHAIYRLTAKNRIRTLCSVIEYGLPLNLIDMGSRSIVMSVFVCLSVCVCFSVHDRIFGTTRPIFTKSFVHVIYGRGSVLLWRRSDTLCTSGFMDDVMFAHKPRLLDVAAQLKRSAHVALGLAMKLCAVIPVAGQRTHWTTFRALFG